MIYLFTLFLNIILASGSVYAEKNLSGAITQPVQITDISEYDTYPVIVKALILKASHLTQMNLTYLYGSSDPGNKGMDCSGTIYYLLSQTKLDNVPRTSDEMFRWVEKEGDLYKVTSRDFNSPEFSRLKPGDLLFWSGTYGNRGQSITHVMLYLGKNKKGERIMFGSSDGRTYQGKKMWGVSVFDFNLPDGKGPQRFAGYGCIPHLTCDK